MALLLALLVGISFGCATTGGTEAGDDAAAQQREGEQSEEEKSQTSEETAAGAPDGFADTEVMNVFSTASGSAVALSADEGTEKIVPIFISESQAMAIKLRLERRRYSRPLTHDLLDNIVEELDGEVSKVHIDAVKSGVFVGTVFVETGDQTYEFDARSSDAIALAVGNQVPIFVADGVFEEAGVPKQKLENRGFDGGRDRMPSPEEEGGGGESEQKEKQEGSEEGESSEGGPYF